MSNVGIPAPAMPGGRRPTSSIAQTAAITHEPPGPDPMTPPDTEGGTATPAAQGRDVAKHSAAKEDSDKSAVQNDRPASVGRKGNAGGKRDQGTPRENMAKVSRIQKPILLKLDEDLKERMVNTMEWTGPRTGLRNQQVFIRRAIADLCERLEKEHNSGNPFPLIVDALEA